MFCFSMGSPARVRLNRDFECLDYAVLNITPLLTPFSLPCFDHHHYEMKDSCIRLRFVRGPSAVTYVVLQIQYRSTNISEE